MTVRRDVKQTITIAVSEEMSTAPTIAEVLAYADQLKEAVGLGMSPDRCVNINGSQRDGMTRWVAIQSTEEQRGS